MGLQEDITRIESEVKALEDPRWKWLMNLCLENCKHSKGTGEKRRTDDVCEAIDSGYLHTLKGILACANKFGKA
jgi:hypothetical protein